MKKHLVSLVAFVSLLALASCASDPSTTSSSTPTSQSSTSSSAPASSSTTSSAAEESNSSSSATPDSSVSSSAEDSSDSSSSSAPDPVIVEATSVTLDKENLTLEVGAEETLTATIAPENVTDTALAWESSAEDVVSVTTSGKVKALKAGTAVITVRTSNDLTDTCTITVTQPVTGITLSQTSLKLTVGDPDVTLTATVTPDDATDKTVTWESSKTDVATVEDGVVHAVKAGETTITAKAGAMTATCTVVVSEKAPDLTVVEKGKLGLWQSTAGKAMYFSGKMDGFYLGTTTDYAAAVDVTVYDATNEKVYLSFGDGQYIGAAVNDGYNNILIQTEPYAWDYNEEYDAYYTNLGEKDLWIGNSKDFDTLSLNYWDYIGVSGNNVAHVVQEEIEKPEEKPVEPENQHYSLAEVKELENGTTFITRGYWLGGANKTSQKGDNNTYNALFIGDGDVAYMLYNVADTMISPLNLVVGETLVEVE